MGYWLVTYPIDSVKSAIQSGPADPRQRQHRRFIETARYLIKHEGGVRRLFKGYGLCVLRAGPPRRFRARHPHIQDADMQDIQGPEESVAA